MRGSRLRRGLAAQRHPAQLGFATLVAALAVTGIGSAPALGASLAFFEPPSSPESAEPGTAAIAAADFDADGDTDLATANVESDNVTVLKNNGAGNFFEPPSSPELVGDAPSDIVAADLDADGDQDIAVVNRASDDVTVLKNNGAGNFFEPPASPEPAGVEPDSITAADVDADADTDIAVASRSVRRVNVLKNMGNGNLFRPFAPEIVGLSPEAIVAADLDGDGDPDLATANQNSDDVTILMNNGAGNYFEPSWSPEPLGAGHAPAGIVAADLDGDLDADLAIGNFSSNDVTVLKNNGAGNYIEPLSSPEPVSTNTFPDVRAVGAADFDADGDLDLAATLYASDGVSILGNMADSGNFFQPAGSPFPTGLLPVDVVATDLDGDLDLDLATANLFSDDVTVLKNR